jgi:hypothetical protein
LVGIRIGDKAQEDSAMVRSMRICAFVVLALGMAGVAACSKQEPTSNTQPKKEAAPIAVKKTTAKGTIKADPNPVKVCDGTGAGVTNLSWSADVDTIEVRIDAPDGSLFAHTGADGGGKPTGKWVRDGTVVYLQDLSGGNPLTAENTIATLTLRVTTEGCP